MSADTPSWEGEAPAEPCRHRRHHPQRKRPASGVFLSRGKTTIVHVSVCTRRRRRWLATPEVHDLLTHVWREATAWLVGRYVIMPDHIHLFAAPGSIDMGVATGGEKRSGRRCDDLGSAGASPSQNGSAGASPSQNSHGGSAGASPSHGGSAGASPSHGGSAGASPSRGPGPEVDLDGWVMYWKSRFTQAYGRGPRLWQPRQWDTRLRRGENYDSKWQYVRENPVRHGLVAQPEDWPFQGEIFLLEWRG